MNIIELTDEQVTLLIDLIRKAATAVRNEPLTEETLEKALTEVALLEDIRRQTKRAYAN